MGIDVQSLVLMFKYFLLISIIVYWLKVRKLELPSRIGRAVNALIHIAVLQFILGISTLLLFVPTILAAAHQATAMILLTVSLYLCHAFSRGSS